MKEKIQTLLGQLNHGLVEREHTLKSALLTVLSGENLVLIGPPGTGKSLIARRIADALAGAADDYFEYLLTKFSTPEEIFGPLSISELKADRFKRNTAGYLPTVRMAFLDEIFKASSSILNALLTILNERLYHNGAERQQVPLLALIAASNELPTDQEELNALYDRFLVRVFVDYVSDDNLPLLFEHMAEPELSPASQFNADDFERIRRATEGVAIPAEIVQLVQRIWMAHKDTFKEDRRESLSDRRLKKVVKLLRVSAATNGRREVDLSDVFLLKDCLWNHPDNAIKVRDLVLGTLQGFSRQVPCDEALQLAGPVSEPVGYELADDGKTLVPASSRKTAVALRPSSALVPAGGRQGVVVKGFKGSGTAQDPLLIETIEHLMDLDRPEVGHQGYHFKQTVDIEYSKMTTWPKIVFRGNYNGCGNLIRLKSSSNSNSYLLFNQILDGSKVENIVLENLGVAWSVISSEIKNCESDCNFVTGDLVNSKIIDCFSYNSLIYGKAIDSVINSCASNASLIGGEAKSCIINSCISKSSLIFGGGWDCNISCCISESFLISGGVKDCIINDCLVEIKGMPSIRASPIRASSIVGMLASSIGFAFINDGAGIARNFLNSVVKRCFVLGKLDRDMNFSGIAIVSKGSKIMNCAVGRLDFKATSDKKDFLPARIVSDYDKTSILKGNVSTDSNRGVDDGNGKDGKSVAADLFKQRYFENTMGWDFDNIWCWDDQENRPALRSVGVGSRLESSVPAQPQPQAPDVPTTDLLTQQIRANIWL